jgi:hypothetical protein
MKKLHMLSLASALVIGAATTGFAATSNDSSNGSNGNTMNPSSTTVTPGVTTGAQGSSTMTSQNGPYATPAAPPGAATVGPTGSLTRDANNPKGASRPGGGDSGGGGKH